MKKEINKFNTIHKINVCPAKKDIKAINKNSK